jgi:3-isopropylmalate/(R)-2-methylmalate dehydratase small subunit
MSKILQLAGRALPLRGDDLDTDRIMPARFLRAVTFEGLERHLFEDDRAARPDHPFNDPRYRGATVLIVNRNFGCGSSREHAPQGIARAGFKAVIGESFSEIFAGNAVMLGMPCFTADRARIEHLQSLVEQAPETIVHLDVATGRVRAGTTEFTAQLPPVVRDAFVTGQWSPTAMLLDNYDAVRSVAARLPYVEGFPA